MWEWFQGLVQQHGYITVFGSLMFGVIGLPLPEETLLMFAGFLVQQGDMRLVPTYVAGWLGATSGITCSYLIGLVLGMRLIRRYGGKVRISPESVDKAHDWYRHRGRWLLAFGYFLPGVRHLTALVAGGTGLEKRTFVTYAYPGALAWSAFYITVGYVVGEAWEQVLSKITNITSWLAAALVVVLAGYLGYRYWQRRKGNP